MNLLDFSPGDEEDDEEEDFLGDLELDDFNAEDEEEEDE